MGMTTCSACGAPVLDIMDDCPYCGRPIALRVLDQNEDIKKLIKVLEQELESDKSIGSQVAGCTFLLLVPLIVIAVIMGVVLERLHWLAALGLGFGGVMLSFSLALLLERWVQKPHLEKTFAKVIQPQIETYLRQHSLNQQEFNRVAFDILEAKSNLRRYLLTMKG